jgi:hypothetical protein
MQELFAESLLVRDLTRACKRNVSIHGLQKRLEADEVVLQTPISVEEQEGRILPTGQISREAMRLNLFGSMAKDVPRFFISFSSMLELF